MTNLQQAAEVQRALDSVLRPLLPVPEVIELPPDLAWPCWDAAVKAQDEKEQSK